MCWRCWKATGKISKFCGLMHTFRMDLKYDMIGGPDLRQIAQRIWNERMCKCENKKEIERKKKHKLPSSNQRGLCYNDCVCVCVLMNFKYIIRLFTQIHIDCFFFFFYCTLILLAISLRLNSLQRTSRSFDVFHRLLWFFRIDTYDASPAFALFIFIPINWRTITSSEWLWLQAFSFNRLSAFRGVLSFSQTFATHLLCVHWA